MAIDEKSFEWHAGMGTTPGMWEWLSETLEGESLPESVSAALIALRDGTALVVPRRPTEAMIETAHLRDPLACDVPEGEVAMVYGAIWKAMLLEACEKPPMPPTPIIQSVEGLQQERSNEC